MAADKWLLQQTALLAVPTLLPAAGQCPPPLDANQIGQLPVTDLLDFGPVGVNLLDVVTWPRRQLVVDNIRCRSQVGQPKVLIIFGDLGERFLEDFNEVGLASIQPTGGQDIVRFKGERRRGRRRFGRPGNEFQFNRVAGQLRGGAPDGISQPIFQPGLGEFVSNGNRPDLIGG